jgi:hypothetical protein
LAGPAKAAREKEKPQNGDKKEVNYSIIASIALVVNKTVIQLA